MARLLSPRRVWSTLIAWVLVVSLNAANVRGASIENCPGYKTSNVQKTTGKLTADLTLAGDDCNVYGTDIKNLRLLVEYQSKHRLHVKIYDAEEQVYQVPDSVIPRPSSESVDDSDMEFDLQENKFSFTVTRKSTGDILFDTSAASLIFESEYLRLRTSLPPDPNLYGLGESADSLRLPTSNYFRTFWNAGEPFLPKRENLYGSHNIYYDHRGANGTHAVFLLSSSGIKVNIDKDDTGQYLEYNSLGGVFDFYFMSGSNPKETSMEYAKTIGYPAMMPYWGFGFHQCRYGYQDVYEVAGVIANYSTANIPLETMWTDIDYMNYRKTLSLDPARFPLDQMRQMVDHLHAHHQNYILMVDPAVAKQPYTPFQQGQSADVFLKWQNESIYTGVVWAGPSVFPDWFAPNTQDYWTEQFARFFSADSGVDIDGLWIDMNEASNFCDETCDPSPQLLSIQSQDPPRPPPARLSSPYAVPGFPSNFQPSCVAYVTFNVNAKVNATNDVLLIMGDAFSLGENVPAHAPPLYPYATSPPVWNTTVQLPANTKVTYQYVLYEYSTDGSYIFEKQNRTITTGSCNNQYEPQQIHDARQNSSESKGVVLRDRSVRELEVRQEPPQDKPGSMQGLPGRNLLYPPYNISSYWPWQNLSVQTLPTNLYHANGLVELDVHNLYGTMMSTASRNAMISRRPGRRPLIITRSTFAGAGRHVGHWFGDNISTWMDYRISIRQMIEFAGLFQFPMVGSDVCGFNDNTTVPLCSRWATLGAFYPFFRNHAEYHTIPQEFYRWPLVAEAARNAISTRYRLLDYLYTAMYRQNQTGSPTINALFFEYPEDSTTFAIQDQFFFGDSILVSPVLEENQTSVTAYMPNDLFYDFNTHQAVRGNGAKMTFTNVGLTNITTHIKGGSIIPMRAQSANTTTELRKQNFIAIVAPSLNGTAAGSLYLDDGDSLVQPLISDIQFTYSKKGVFSMSGLFGYDSGVIIESVVVLGVPNDVGKSTSAASYDITARSLTHEVNLPLTKSARLNLLEV